jgi:hypothetical protein
MGLLFAPMTTIAMRNIPPQMAGAASGVFNSFRQLGSVMGSAVVGAILQAQLAINVAAGKPYPLAFVDAMRPAIAIPVAVVFVGAFSTLLTERRKKAPAAETSSDSAVLASIPA